MWGDPPRDGRLSAEVASWDRHTRFELVRRLPLAFPTHHPQGMALVGGRIFLSTVEIFEAPEPAPGSGDDPALRTPGRGQGHVLVIDPEGTLLADVPVGSGTMYHPGGIDHAEGLLWIPVAEYRADSRSLICTVDPESLEVRERYEVEDHVSLLSVDVEAESLIGAGWGSRRFHSWWLSGDGSPRSWDNPSAFVDFQDVQHDGAGRLIAGGIAELPTADGGVHELGGLAVVDVRRQRILAQTPLPMFSTAGHTVLRNPFVLTRDAQGTVLHVAPDDGDEAAGTELLSYRVLHESRNAVRSGKLDTLT